MKKKKLIGCLIILLVTALSITACSKKEAETVTKDEEPLVIKLSVGVNERDCFYVTAAKFKELIEQRTQGKVNIEIYPNAVLGDERTTIEGMQSGTMDMGVVTCGPIANFFPDISAFEMPFLFASAEEAYKVLDGPVGKKVLKQLEHTNLKGLAFAERGFRNLTNSKRPVMKPEDIKGLKIRVMENPLYIDTFKALGANAVPMAWTETLTALQQGTIDGQENPVNVAYSFKMYETQKYLTMTQHTYAPALILMSKQKFESLDNDTQAIFLEAAQDAAEYEREWNTEQMSIQMDFIREHGMEIAEPDLAPFQEAMRVVYDKYGDKFGTLLEEIQAAK